MARVRRWGLLGPAAAATSSAYSFVAVEPNGRQLQRVLDLAVNGTIRAVIDDQARAAFVATAGTGTTGNATTEPSAGVDGSNGNSTDFLLSEAALAHAYLERGHATGKVLLKVRAAV